MRAFCAGGILRGPGRVPDGAMSRPAAERLPPAGRGDGLRHAKRGRPGAGGPGSRCPTPPERGPWGAPATPRLLCPAPYPRL